jgi:glycogen phosphorylase
MSEQTERTGSAAARCLSRTLLPSLEGLSDLALDMRWSWNHEADALRERVDPELWEATSNPWLILQSVSLARLEKLARDHQFMNELHVLSHHAGLEVVR